MGGWPWPSVGPHGGGVQGLSPGAGGSGVRSPACIGGWPWPSVGPQGGGVQGLSPGAGGSGVRSPVCMGGWPWPSVGPQGGGVQGLSFGVGVSIDVGRPTWPGGWSVGPQGGVVGGGSHGIGWVDGGQPAGVSSHGTGCVDGPHWPGSAAPAALTKLSVSSAAPASVAMTAAKVRGRISALPSLPGMTDLDGRGQRDDLAAVDPRTPGIQAKAFEPLGDGCLEIDVVHVVPPAQHCWTCDGTSVGAFAHRIGRGGHGSLVRSAAATAAKTRRFARSYTRRST